MSLGLGYIADGFIKGQERNRSWGLRQKQEERAQASEDRAAGMYPYQQRTAAADATIKEYNASDHNLGLLDRRNIANTEEAESRAGIAKYQSSGEYMDTLYQGIKAGVTGKQLYNQRTQQQVDLGAEEFSSVAKQKRENKRKYELEAQKWEYALSKTVNQNDQTEARLKTSKLIDERDYRVLQLIKGGDHLGAATLINSFSDNPHRNIVTIKQTNDGGIAGFDESGKVSVRYTKEQIEALERRRQSEIAKTRKEPKVQMIEQPLIGTDGNQVIDDAGNFVMQKIPYSYNPQTDNWDPIRTSGGDQKISRNDVDPEFYELAWKQAVLQGNRTPEGFIKEYGYDPRKPTSPGNGEFDEGELISGGLTVDLNNTSEKTAPRLGINALKQL